MAKADNGQKLFSTEFNGFNKKQVTEYIATLEQKYKESIAQKERDINALEVSYNELQDKYAELFDSYMALQEEKSKIADVLIGAENRAAEIIDQARADAEKERVYLEAQSESLRETIVDKNKIIKDMKAAANSMTADFEAAIKTKMEEIFFMIDKSMAELNDRADAVVDDAESKNTADLNFDDKNKTTAEEKSEIPSLSETDDSVEVEDIISDDTDDESDDEESAISDEIESIFTDDDKNDGDFL